MRNGDVAWRKYHGSIMALMAAAWRAAAIWHGMARGSNMARIIITSSNEHDSAHRSISRQQRRASIGVMAASSAAA